LMRNYLLAAWLKLLEFLRLSPLSLAEKCRIAFGAAVILVLALALLLPYVWMGQLTRKASLDAARAKATTLLRRHFQLPRAGQGSLAPLDDAGQPLDEKEPEIRWIRFSDDSEKQLRQLSAQQQQMIESLKSRPAANDMMVLEKKTGVLYSNYARIFRATDSCISCHNPQGPAGLFNRDEPIGAVIIQRNAGEITKTVLMNRVWIIAAGLIAGTGAIVAFYMITQRVILRPIRQLRALANNVAEGNLDIRSSIRTRDEYEKFANAFNNMLDGLQSTQRKLRDANRQLDTKIAELSERNIELYKANKVKGEFLANVSHEFRTPLNAILGFAEILREKPELLSSEKGRRYAENIITSGKNILNMINDLLDLAKTEAGKMTMHIEETAIEPLCRELMASFSVLTKKKKIKARMLVDDKIPLLQTDGGKVRQILYNFLSNAVKFTPERGRIEIRVSMPDDMHVRVAVADTGCGIAEADREKIFEKFRQSDGSITRQSTGTGLGLAISRELATLLAGTIGLESEVGAGSTFWLDIPVKLAKKPDSTEAPETPLSA